MATNSYFQQGYAGEQELLQDLVTEAIQHYGQDCFYLPRTIIEEDTFLGETIESLFETAVPIEMYPEQFDSFDGEGNLFSKFGIEIRDQFELSVSKERWVDDVFVQTNHERPYEGSLVYFPLSKSLFEIRFVEHEKPFYQLNSFPKYTLRLELFEYSGEAFNTGIEEIDQIEYRNGSGGITLVAIEYSSDPLEGSPIEGSPIEGSPITASTDIEDLIGEFFIDQSTGHKTKLYSAVTSEDDSPITFGLSFGQYQGGITTDSILIHDASPSLLSLKVISVVGIDSDDATDTSFIPNDPNTDNVTIEQEADQIIDFTEENPFGEF